MKALPANNFAFLQQQQQQHTATESPLETTTGRTTYLLVGDQ